MHCGNGFKGLHDNLLIEVLHRKVSQNINYEMANAIASLTIQADEAFGIEKRIFKIESLIG